jgi:hypothetical protein
MKQVCHTREKFLSHIVMMGRRMMLCEIISQVGFTRPPIETKLFFGLPLNKPFEAHIHQFGAFWLYF